MGRPPGAKNVGGSNGGAKNSSKPVAGGGKSVAKSSNPTTAAGGGAGEKDKSTMDRSQSNFPYDIRLNGYASLHNAVSKGTPRIKRILTEECDYIMECRVCRNLFRSLPNFITHKLNYCKKAFDSTWCIGLSNLIQSGNSPSATSFNVEYEVDPELVLISSPANLSSSNEAAYDNQLSESISSITRTRSVADLYNELAERTKARIEKVTSQSTPAATSPHLPSTTVKNDSSNVIRLQLKPLAIPGENGDSNCNVVSSGGMKSIVVQQQILSNDPSSCDNACTKSADIVRKDTAILGPDGKVLCTAPGKGIEQVVSRLTAQLKALEEKEAQKMTAAMAKCTIICDVCKTVFDSDKALRQHKRESLDCGKTWGFKSPINHEKSTPMKLSASSENSRMIPNKRAKLPIDGDGNETKSTSGTECASTTRNQAEPAQPVKLSRLNSPPKGRRPSNHHSVNGVLPYKPKRNISPVKKIKLKYIKLDSSSSRECESGRKHVSYALSCHRCSSSFATKYEMSLHLALCTGVINYAFLKESEPPQEKIRISLRNEFSKAPTAIPTPQASPSFNAIVSESHTTNFPSRERLISGASSSRGDTPTAEVNNNKQYKISYQQQHALSGIASSSSEEESLPVVPLQLTPTPLEEEGDSDITSHDSGVSSTGSTKRNASKVSKAGKKVKIVKPINSVLAPSTIKFTNSSVSSTSSSTAKTTKLNCAGTLAERPESVKTKNTVKKAKASTTTCSKVRQQKQNVAFNLRKTVQSRIRKSRRILRSPQQKQLKAQKKLT